MMLRKFLLAIILFLTIFGGNSLVAAESDSSSTEWIKVRRAQRKGPIPAPPIESDHWYSVKEVSDGSEFRIEVKPGFEYGVEFLGVEMPRIYAGSDSSDYYSAEAAKYLRNLISGDEVKLQGAGIGPVYAKRIMTYRKENGQFTDVEQLRSINGIGPKTMQKLRSNVILEK